MGDAADDAIDSSMNDWISDILPTPAEQRCKRETGEDDEEELGKTTKKADKL